MAVRQDKVQISIAFLTDESKAFAKLVEDNKKFISDIQKAKKEGKDLTDVIQKMTQSGKEISKIPLDKLAPAQLIARAQQLKQVLDLIPKSAPEYKQLANEYKNINDQLASMRAETKGVAQAMNEARAPQSSFFNSMTSMIGRVMVLWFGLKSAISSLFEPSKLASDMEQARIAFTTMLGSVRESAKITLDIIRTAATTPFETAELIDYAKRLLAMGIEGNKVVATMRRLGDMAAGVGKEKLPQIVLAFGQVAAKTKLAGGELKQFTEAGIPLVGELAKIFNVAEAEIFKMIEAGKIGFKDVEKAIENMTNAGGKFAGLMAKQAQTTEGLMSTLKDNVSLTLAEFGDGFNIAFKEILKSSIAFTNGLDREKVRDFGIAVGNALKFVIEFTPALLKIVAIFAAFKVVSAAQTAITGFTTAMKASETVTLLFNNGLARTIGLQTLMNRLFSAAAIPVWGAAITAAIFVVQSLYEKMTALSQVQKDLNNAQLEGAKAAQEEMQSATDLFAIIRDTSVSYETRKGAINKVLELYPEYLGGITSEKELLEKLDTAQQRVNQGIIDSVFARIKAEEMHKRVGEQVAREIELTNAKQKALEAENQRNITRGTPSTGLNTYDAQTRTSINAGQAAAAVRELERRNKDLNNANLQFFKNFDGVALETAKILNKNFSPSWNYLNVQIQETKKLLAKDPNNQGLKDQLASFEKQRLAEMQSLIKGNAVKKQLVEDDSKAQAKAEKEALKRLKESLDARIDEINIAYQIEENQSKLAFLTKQKTESDYTFREIELERDKYAVLQSIYEDYQTKFEKGSKEFRDAQIKALDAQLKVIEKNAELLKLSDRAVNTRGTDALPTAKAGPVAGAPVQGEISKIQDLANLEKGVMATRFQNLVFGEQQLQIARLQIQQKAYDAQLAALEAAGLKDTKQYEQIAKKKKDVDASVAKNKKELEEAEISMQKTKMSILHDSFGVVADLLSKDEAARKKNALAIKAFNAGQVIVDGVQEVQAIWRNAAQDKLNAVPGGFAIINAIAAVRTALSAGRTVAALAKIKSAKFAGGGFTGNGMPFTDETGHRPAGIVHNDEWVGPQWMTKHPQMRPIFNYLENIRVKGFADGGYVSTTPNITVTPPSVSATYGGIDPMLLVSEFRELRKDVATWNTKLKAEVYRDEYEASANRDDAARAKASL